MIEGIRNGLSVYRLAGRELVGGIVNLYSSYDDGAIDGITVVFFDGNGFFASGEVSIPIKLFESSFTIHKAVSRFSNHSENAAT